MPGGQGKTLFFLLIGLRISFFFKFPGCHTSDIFPTKPVFLNRHDRTLLFLHIVCIDYDDIIPLLCCRIRLPSNIKSAVVDGMTSNIICHQIVR